MVLSSFFGKSKPINFMLMAAYVLVFWVIANFKIPKPISFGGVVVGMGSLILYLLSISVLNFITRRNELGGNNSYLIISFAACSTLLPEALVAMDILGANIYILLAFQRILSLRSQKNIQKKIMDAALCIAVASICYFWSILFLAVLFLGIAYYAFQDYRNWLLPFLGMAAVYVLATCFSLWTGNTFISFSEYVDGFSIYFRGYRTVGPWISFLSVAVIALFFLSRYLLRYQHIQTKIKKTIVLVIAQLVTGILIFGVIPDKKVAALFFMTPYLAITMVSCLESKINPFGRELLLWILLVLPVIRIVF